MEHVEVLFAVVAIAALIGSTFGFGNSLVIVPIMTYVMPLQQIVPISSMVALTISIVVALEDRGKNIINKEICLLSACTLLGVPVGVSLLLIVQPKVLEFVLGLLLITVSCNALFGIKISINQKKIIGWPFAVTAGIFTGCLNTGGPPLVIYGVLRNWRKDQIRSYMRVLFIPTNIVNLFILSASGIITREILTVGLICSGMCIPLTIVGRVLNRVIPVEKFRMIIWILLLILGFNLMRQFIMP